MDTQSNTPEDQKPASNIPYVIAIVVMFLLAILTIVIISITRPGQDLSIVMTAVFGIFTPTTLSLLTFMKSDQTHSSVNSRLSQFIEASKRANVAEGKAEGLKEGIDTANARTDQITNESK